MSILLTALITGNRIYTARISIELKLNAFGGNVYNAVFQSV